MYRFLHFVSGIINPVNDTNFLSFYNIMFGGNKVEHKIEITYVYYRVSLQKSFLIKNVVLPKIQYPSNHSLVGYLNVQILSAIIV